MTKAFDDNFDDQGAGGMSVAGKNQAPVPGLARLAKRLDFYVFFVVFVVDGSKERLSFALPILFVMQIQATYCTAFHSASCVALFPYPCQSVLIRGE